MTARICGGCTACCFALKVAGFPGGAKPRDTHCVHECAAGCAIYANRPEACLGYTCLWLAEGAEPGTPGAPPPGFKKLLREEDRPDRSGVFFTPAGPTWVTVGGVRRQIAWLACYESRVGATEREWSAKKLLQRLSRHRLILLVRERRFIGPEDLVRVATERARIDDVPLRFNPEDP